MRPISTAMPPLLTVGCHLVSNSSHASTAAGPKMGMLDCCFALCRALFSLLIFVHFASPPLSPIRNAFRTRLGLFLRFRHRVEQTCGRRPDVCTIGRSQTAHAIFRFLRTLLDMMALFLHDPTQLLNAACPASLVEEV